MRLNRLTVWFIVGVVAIIVAFDVFQMATAGYDATISAVLYCAAQAYPVIPFVFGLVGGHLFWPNHAAKAS